MMGYYDSDALMAVFAGLAIVFIVFGIFALVLYILKSIGIMTIARNRGLNMPWLVWVPYVGSYTVGAVADDIGEKEGGSRGIFRWLLLGGSLLSLLMSGGSYASLFGSIMEEDINALAATSAVSNLGSLVGLAYYIVHIIALNKIYKCYKPESATTYTVLSAIPFTAFMQSILPFTLRNRQPAVSGYGGMGGGYGAPGGYNGPGPGGYGAPPQSGYGQTPPPQGGYGQTPPQGWQPPQNPYGQDMGQQAPPAPPSGDGYDRQTGQGIDDQ